MPFARSQSPSPDGSRAGAAGFTQRVRSGAPLPPSGELVSAQEFEALAQAVLPAAEYAKLAGGNRAPFERMTFRQKLMVNAEQLDLSTELFGQRLFAPIVVGPVAAQGEFHPQGELETARGAAAARAAMVVSSRSSQPVGAIAAETDQPLWLQVYSDDGPAARSVIREAVDSGVKAVCVTAGGPATPGTRGFAPAPVNWNAVMRIAERAGASLTLLPDIAGAAGATLAVLVDGGFRRGTDVLKALALGAHAGLVARSIMWGLAAYGSAGVEAVLHLLQNELARSMAMAGRPAIGLIDRALVKVHSRWAPGVVRAALPLSWWSRRTVV